MSGQARRKVDAGRLAALGREWPGQVRPLRSESATGRRRSSKQVTPPYPPRVALTSTSQAYGDRHNSESQTVATLVLH